MNAGHERCIASGYLQQPIVVRSIERCWKLPIVKAFSRYVSNVRLGGVSSTTTNESSRRLVSNVALKTIADVVSKSVTLIVTVVAARTLSTADFGVLAIAMTTGWLLSVASDAGLPLFLAREAAQPTGGRQLSLESVRRVVRIRSMFGAVALASSMAIALIVVPRASVLTFVLIVCAQLATAVVDTLSHAYRGIGRSDIESLLMLVVRITTGVLAVTLLLISPSLLGLAVVFAALPLAALLVSLGISARVFPRGTAGEVLDLSARRFAGDIGPIGAGILVSAIYFRCDVYFVEWWHGIDTVGVYNAAFRVVEALRLFPAAVLAVAFPALCRARDVRPVRHLSVLLVVGGGLLTSLLVLAAPTLLEVLYGPRFIEAGPALQILALALPLFFMNYALTHQVIAWQGQHAYLAITLIALVTNLAGNVMLIPTQGMIGAAAATLATEIAVSVGCVVTLMRMRRPADQASIHAVVDLTSSSVRAQ